MEPYLPQAAALQEQFLRRLATTPPTAAWEMWAHAEARQVSRSIRRQDVEEVLLCGQPIEMVAFGPRGGRLILLGETERGRPLHLVCEFPSPRQGAWGWRVVTVYDPRTEAWRWSPDFSRRTCRCHQHVRHAAQEV
jgi:hypothetical protein